MTLLPSPTLAAGGRPSAEFLSPKGSFVEWFSGSDKNLFAPLSSAGAETREAPQFWTPEQVPHRHRYRPLVIMYTGRRGDCKSVSMTGMGYAQLRRFRRYNAGRPPARRAPFDVATNYEVSFASYVDPKLFERLADYPDWARNLHIMGDEISTVTLSRRSMRSENVNTSQWLTQIRKRRCDVSFTTQFPQVVDLQVLLQVDLFVRVRGYNFDKEGHPTSALLQVYDWWGQWTGKDHRKPWPPRPPYEDWYVHLHNLQRIWPMYRTDQEQIPTWYKNRDELLRLQGYRWGDEDEYGGEATEEERGIIMPETLEEFLDLLPDEMPNLAAVMDYVQHYNPRLVKNRLASLLEDRGYVVVRQGGWAAFRQAEPQGGG